VLVKTDIEYIYFVKMANIDILLKQVYLAEKEKRGGYSV